MAELSLVLLSNFEFSTIQKKTKNSIELNIEVGYQSSVAISYFISNPSIAQIKVDLNVLSAVKPT